MRDLQGLLARMFDVAMIVCGAAVASQIRFDDIAGTPLLRGVRGVRGGVLACAVSGASASIESWRGRSKLALASQVSLAWLIVQALRARADVLAAPASTSCRGCGSLTGPRCRAASLIAGPSRHACGARPVRNAGMNLHQVAVVGCGKHCDAIVRKIDRSPAAGFRATAVCNATPEARRINTRVPVFDDIVRFRQLRAHAERARSLACAAAHAKNARSSSSSTSSATTW